MKNISRYAKFVVAALGFAVTVATAFVATFGSTLPAGTVAWITSAIAAATSIGVFITKNEDEIEKYEGLVVSDLSPVEKAKDLIEQAANDLELGPDSAKVVRSIQDQIGAYAGQHRK